MSNDPEQSDSGNPIYRHSAPTGDPSFSVGNPETIEAISAHVERHLGPIGGVFHEIVSEYAHIDVHIVPPTSARPHYTLITSGMSDRPMSVPEEAADFAYAELMVSLPASWPLDEAALKDETHYWPIRSLKQLARFPHMYNTWLGFGHSIPNGDPPEPFAPSTQLCGMVLLPPLSYSEEVFELEMDGRTIRFWSLLPVYREEMKLKLRKGTEALLNKLDEHGIDMVVDPSRVNVAKRRFRWFR